MSNYNESEIESLILNDVELKNHPFYKVKNEIYKIEIANKTKALLFFGTAHTNIPEDPIFTEIQNNFKTFKPDLVLVEGCQFINKDNDNLKKHFIKNPIEKFKTSGENLFTLKLAIDNGIDFESPEPEFADEINDHLSKGYSKHDIYLFWIYRDVYSFLRKNKTTDTEKCLEYLRSSIKEFRRESGWEESELESIEKSIFDNFELKDAKYYLNLVTPILDERNKDSITNIISNNSSQFRDRYILRRIHELLKNHDRVFAVYGSGHAVKLERALEKVMELSS